MNFATKVNRSVHNRGADGEQREGQAGQRDPGSRSHTIHQGHDLQVVYPQKEKKLIKEHVYIIDLFCFLVPSFTLRSIFFFKH